MSETSDLEAKLNSEQANYLKRLEGAGQLPTIVTNAWNTSGGQAETEKLNANEADLLKKYVSSAADARSEYGNIWNPLERDILVQRRMGQQYGDIAGVRKELVMRAEALGLATSSAKAMYNADTAKAQTNLGFTQDAYSRALAREQEQTRQAERQQDLAAAAKKRGTTKTETSNKIRDQLSNLSDTYKSMSWDELKAEAQDEGFDPVFTRDYIYEQFKAMYPSISQTTIKNWVYKEFFPDNWR